MSRAPQECHECHAPTVVLYYIGRRHFAKRCSTCGHKWNEEREVEIVGAGNYVTDYPESYERGMP